MTKVKFQDGAVEFRISLSGRFAGPPVQEVRQAWVKKLNDSRSSRVTVDISTLSDYDAAGRKLLREMYLHGIHFAASTPASLVFLSEISSPKRSLVTMLPDHPPDHSIDRMAPKSETESSESIELPSSQAAGGFTRK